MIMSWFSVLKYVMAVYVTAGDLAASNACQNLISCISTRPTIHLAVRSLLTTTPNINPTTTTTTPTVRSSPPPSQQESSPAQAAVANVGPQAQSPEEQKQAMIIQMTMHAVLRLLTAYIPNSPASISGRSLPPHPSRALCTLVNVKSHWFSNPKDAKRKTRYNPQLSTLQPVKRP